MAILGGFLSESQLLGIHFQSAKPAFGPIPGTGARENAEPLVPIEPLAPVAWKVGFPVRSASPHHS
jgi:hypothetical protein